MATEVFNSRPQTMSLGPDPAQQQPEEEQFLSTFFCRALFDYQTDNDSSLSFRRDDIIEVLTRLESGWWDGLLGQERGWFPSNYVTIISDQEADAALAAAEAAVAAQLEFQGAQTTVGNTHDFELRTQIPSPLRNGTSPMSPSNHTHTLSLSQNTQPHANITYPQQDVTAASIGLQGAGLYPRSGTQSSDFWVPQVSADGRVSTTFPCSNSVFSAFHSLEHSLVFMTCPHTPSATYLVMGAYSLVPWRHFFQIYYVNTQTGQQSRDLPQDVDQDISEGELPSPATLAAVRLMCLTMITTDVATINGPRNGAGFGLPRRSSTPEPWKRVLADDGLSYYFVNTDDGTISLTMPSASTQQLHASQSGS
jgi:son of sevenless-like protein